MFKKKSYTFLFFFLTSSASLMPLKVHAAPIAASADELDLLTEQNISPDETQPAKPKWYSPAQYKAVRKSGVAIFMMVAYMKGKISYYWQAVKMWFATHMPVKYETVK
jgi:hypothetical protein